MPPLEHVPLWEGRAPEEGTPRISGYPSRRKGSAHTSPGGRGLRPPARGGNSRRARRVSCPGAINLAGPMSRTGFQRGQFIVREGAQRPVIKGYVYIYWLCFCNNSDNFIFLVDSYENVARGTLLPHPYPHYSS